MDKRLKLLVVGIDGGEKSVIRKAPMPFLQGLIENNNSIEIEEDINSRGWAEFYLGQHGSETGALYFRPQVDGKCGLSGKLSLTDMLNMPHVNPIWKELADSGSKVGWMNIPTVYPPQETSGFFVGGSAGGGSVAGVATSVPDDQALPAESVQVLRDNNYISDIRVVPSTSFESLEEFFGALLRMATKRAESFAQLAGQYETEVGFIGFRAVNILQNIGMAEVQNWLGNETNGWDSKWPQHLDKFFADFDKQIEQLFDKLTPENFLLISDHGAAPYRKNLNVNALLRREGFQAEFTPIAATIDRLQRAAWRRLRKLGFKQPQLEYLRHTDMKRTQAFGFTFIPGIFLNDERFGGPVASESKKKQLVESICSTFNESSECKAEGISAEPYRENYSATRFQKMLPDIWINKPDEVFTVEQGPLIQANPWYGAIPAVSHLPQSVYTGLKGRHPLCVFSGDRSKLMQDGDPNDLTLAFRVIKRTLGIG